MPGSGPGEGPREPGLEIDEIDSDDFNNLLEKDPEGFMQALEGPKTGATLAIDPDGSIVVGENPEQRVTNVMAVVGERMRKGRDAKTADPTKICAEVSTDLQPELITSEPAPTAAPESPLEKKGFRHDDHRIFR